MSQVDDFLGAGTEQLVSEEAYTSKRFKIRSAEVLENGNELKLNGHYVKLMDGTIVLHKHLYGDLVPSEKIERSDESFMSSRLEASYLASCTRLDLACAVSQIFQYNASVATEEDFECLYNVFKRTCKDRVKLL